MGFGMPWDPLGRNKLEYSKASNTPKVSQGSLRGRWRVVLGFFAFLSLVGFWGVGLLVFGCVDLLFQASLAYTKS